jgi:hypothetical protein
VGGYSVAVAGDTLPHQLKEPTVDDFDYDYEDTYGYEPHEDDAEAAPMPSRTGETRPEQDAGGAERPLPLVASCEALGRERPKST